MHIAVIGTGYVGLVSGACFAEFGNDVTCVDSDSAKIEMLEARRMPIYEPGLAELVEKNVRQNRLHFTTDIRSAIERSLVVMLAVGTPPKDNGAADMSQIEAVALEIARALNGYKVIVTKSTVPVGAAGYIRKIIEENKQSNCRFSVASNPEFLREGAAIDDFKRPDRIVIGCNDEEAVEILRDMYRPLYLIETPFVITTPESAEMIKYASNTFLAMKISFINEIANLCDVFGADVHDVARGMGMDNRIGSKFLHAGPGFGGSCFEGHETVFTLNSPTVATQTLESVFAEGGKPFEGETVQVVAPEDKRVLAFDLETGQPTLAEVKAVTRRPYKGTMVSLATSMGRTLSVTADHPVILRTADGFGIVPAVAVAPGDQMLALCELPAVEPACDLNLIECLQGTPLADDVYISSTDDTFAAGYSRFAAHIPADLMRYPEEIKRGNRMSLRLFYYLSELGLLDADPHKLQLYTALGAATKINAVIPVDADLLRLCGYYLAEGWISGDTGRGGARRERIGFSFNENEIEYISDVQRIVSKWGMKFIHRKGPGSMSVIVSSRVFAWLLRDVLRCGTCSENKTLPRLAFNVPADLRRELVRGAFSGDGSVTGIWGGKNLMLEYATISKSLADGLALLLQSLGVVASIHLREMNKSKHPAYIMRVSGYAQIDALKHTFGEKHRARIEDTLAGYQRHIKQRGFLRQGPYAALTVRAVEYQEVDTTVYSLETSAGTLIASSGLICHNCFPKDVRALAALARESGYEMKLAETVLEVNEQQRTAAFERIKQLVPDLKNKTIAILGLSFKPETDDLRESPSLKIIAELIAAGARVRAYDPVAMEAARSLMPDVEFCEDEYDAARGSDAFVVVTEWNQFRSLDFNRLKSAMKDLNIVDLRNIYEPEDLKDAGFKYVAVGRR